MGSPLGKNPHFALILLTLLYVFNTVDRHILAILADPIGRDLQLSDTQLGLLSGLVFALFYTVFGIPAGWLADRYGRTRVIVVASTLWSLCSAMGGLATNFWHIALARVGVGIGEAGGSAPSYSLISSLYPAERRGTAIGIYHLGASIGSLIAAMAGAWLAVHYGWRVALVVVSCPGMVIGLFLFLTVEDKRPAERTEAVSLFKAVRDYVSTPILLTAGIAAGLSSVTTGATIAWLPTFLIRVKGMEMMQIGSWYAIGNALAFGFGMWFGGFLADRVAVRDRRAYALVPALGLAIAIPFTIAGVFAQSWLLSLLCWMVPIGSVAMFLSPAVALVQNSVPPERRAISGALFLLLNYLIGSGLGPVYIGLISDALAPAYGDQALGYAMLGCVPALLIAIGIQMALARMIRKEGSPGEPVSV